VTLPIIHSEGNFVHSEIEHLNRSRFGKEEHFPDAIEYWVPFTTRNVHTLMKSLHGHGVTSLHRYTPHTGLKKISTTYTDFTASIKCSEPPRRRAIILTASSASKNSHRTSDVPAEIYLSAENAVEATAKITANTHRRRGDHYRGKSKMQIDILRAFGEEGK